MGLNRMERAISELEPTAAIDLAINSLMIVRRRAMLPEYRAVNRRAIAIVYICLNHLHLIC